MLYLESLPQWSRGLVEIPDHPALIRELRLLERIPGRIGKDQVTHPRNCHDDLANAVCAVIALCQTPMLRIHPENVARARMSTPNPRYAQHRAMRSDMRLGERAQAMRMRRF